MRRLLDRAVDQHSAEVFGGSRLLATSPGDTEETAPPAGQRPGGRADALIGKAGPVDELTCEVQAESDKTMIAVRGELDIASRESLTSAVFPWLTPGAHVVLDCAGLPFMDSSGLLALLELRRFANDAGARFTLAAVQPAITALLRIAGVENLFAIE